MKHIIMKNRTKTVFNHNPKKEHAGDNQGIIQNKMLTNTELRKLSTYIFREIKVKQYRCRAN